ncbi:uncharacterized protein MONBRDRAFT_33796 [Monosiga brevicollis MX1]|uniref:guanylate kinase n=1 Tax=Monosiga brevicollis TaxID=81824 RepID=A9V7J9_MONBE|nr:uncharacterized protein MONBRDRAFT_33796 [Monosiga brevicollis MX1]EDQ86596.1 predicted protein [Monosiga brevicollis MX1]|eukprot:XP_001748709.1 hypothetical protein [Monosiga brevicollis MX1]
MRFLAGIFANPAAVMGIVTSCMSASVRTTTIMANPPAKKDQPRPIVVSGPSGAGKSTFLKRLFKEFPDVFALSVSHTTRKPRTGEQDGVDYHFTEREVMEQMIASDEFVEHAQFGGNLYGTSKRAISDVAAQNRICILDIERQGCENVRNLDMQPLFVFVQPPSVEVLEQRLRSRNTETEESLQKRLAEAESAMVYGATPGKFDHVIVNDDLDAAYEKFKACLMPDIEHAKKMQAAA